MRLVCRYVPMGTHTTTDIDAFLSFSSGVLRRSPHTLRAYRHDLSVYADFLRSRRLSARTAGITDLLDFAQTLSDLSARTARRRLSAVSSFHDYLHLTEATERNVAKLVPRPQLVGSHRAPLSMEAVEAMRAACVTLKSRAIFALAYDGMLRSEEIFTAQRASVAPQGAAITVVGKGRKARTVPLPPHAAAVVAEWALSHDSEHLFPSKRRPSGHISYYTIRHTVQSAARRANLDVVVSPHDLRAAGAEHEREAGGDPFIIQRLLGHTKLSTSSGYVNPVLVRVDRSGESYQAPAPLPEIVVRCTHQGPKKRKVSARWQV